MSGQCSTNAMHVRALSWNCSLPVQHQTGTTTITRQRNAQRTQVVLPSSINAVSVAIGLVTRRCDDNNNAIQVGHQHNTNPGPVHPQGSARIVPGQYKRRTGATRCAQPGGDEAGLGTRLGICFGELYRRLARVRNTGPERSRPRFGHTWPRIARS